MGITWDEAGSKFYETGIKNGVLYLYDETAKKYTNGVAWNGLTSVTESPSGAEESAMYADDVKYLSLYSTEEFGATIEAYTYPDEFAECDGSATVIDGVTFGQQSRRTFGLCYRTVLGNDLANESYGYKLHLVYGCRAGVSDRQYETINDSPEAITFSWDITTVPVKVGTVEGTEYKPVSILTIDSTKVDATKLAALEDTLYGNGDGDGVVAELPLPAAVITALKKA